jgi:hypothetical protein
MKLKSLKTAVLVVFVALAFVGRSYANQYDLTFRNTTGAPVNDIEMLIFGDGTAVGEFNVSQVQGAGHTNPGDDWTGSATTYTQAGFPGGIPMVTFAEPAGNGAADEIGNNGTETFTISMSGNLVNLNLSLAVWWTVDGGPVVGNVVNNGNGSYTLTTANGGAITQTPLLRQGVTAPDEASTFLLLGVCACGMFGVAWRNRAGFPLVRRI